MPRRRWIATGGALAGLIFASTLSTGALWRDSLPLGGGQLSSGSLVLLTGDATTQVEAYAFTALAGSNLRPGSSAQAPLTMKNDGSTPLGYRLSETTTIGSATLPGRTHPSDRRCDRRRRLLDRRGRPAGVRPHHRRLRGSRRRGDNSRPAAAGPGGHRDLVRTRGGGRDCAGVGLRRQRPGPLHLCGGAGVSPPRRELRPFLGWTRAIGGWLVLLVVAAFVAATVAIPRLAGGTAYTVTSGSMRPALPPGTLIVTRPADPSALGIGDVITYQAVSDRPAVVTHRIIGVGYAANGEITFRTRGDANDAADAEPVRAVQVRGELWYALPYLGYVNTWVTGRTRSVLVYAVSAVLVGYAGWMFVSTARHRRRTPRRAEGTGMTP